MNSLEDAYINIANEEEKLLEELNKYGMRRRKSSRFSRRHSQAGSSYDIGTVPPRPESKADASSVDEEDLKRYYSAVKRPTCCRQFCANYKRRII